MLVAMHLALYILSGASAAAAAGIGWPGQPTPQAVVQNSYDDCSQDIHLSAGLALSGEKMLAIK
jgi:hypothetical protein